MAAPSLIWRQTWALTKKNWTITIVRGWLATAFRALVLPILILTLLLEIQEFSKSRNVYGVGDPATISSLADTIQGSSRLAIVRGPRVGADVDNVINTIVKPLPTDSVMYLSSEDQIRSACNVNFQGRSDCHAAVVFNESPLSTSRLGASNTSTGTWNYTIQAGPDKGYSTFNALSHDSSNERFWLPLQVAIDNAIANTSIVPDTFQFAGGDEAQFRKREKHNFMMLGLNILSFVLFLTMVTAAHHAASLVAGERESGLSRLLDAMSGGVALPRTIAYAIALDVIYLPLCIIMGVLYKALLLDQWSYAITIFWQIFTGVAVVHSSIFGAAFFPRASLAAIAIPGLAFMMAALAARQENQPVHQPLAQVVILSLLFPGWNYVLFLDFLFKWGIADMPDAGSLTATIPKEKLDQLISPLCKPYTVRGGRYFNETITLPPKIADCGTDFVHYQGAYLFWVLLAVQIVGFLVLAVVAEKYLHGNKNQKRAFHDGAEAELSPVAIEATGLQKHYLPIWTRLFRWSSSGKSAGAVKAVDGLDLVSYRRQILCLLGPNGSGKTTTLEMIAGFQSPTNGSIGIKSGSSKMGICPQKNILWNKMTVREHLVLWNAIKGGSDDAAAIDKIIERCDLVLKRNTPSKFLSGGTKRKLQLACMLVGGSNVCLLDEVTSGLDPISRRVLWNVVLAERSRRTMVFTTHFLDECSVLADHVVILSQGKVKCQGTPAQLKNEYGGGYRVHVPATKLPEIEQLGHPFTSRGEQVVVRMPDSSSAVKLFDDLKTSEGDKVYITGPTIEDVFLRVSSDPRAEGQDPDELGFLDSGVDPKSGASIEINEDRPSPARPVSAWALFFRQLRALFYKRVVVLRSQWFFYLLILAIPIVISSQIGGIIQGFKPLDCAAALNDTGARVSPSFFPGSSVLAGPPSINDSLRALAPSYAQSNWRPILLDSKEALVGFVKDNTTYAYSGGLFADNDTAPLLALPASAGFYSVSGLWSAAFRIRTGARINVYTGFIRALSTYTTGSAQTWAIIFGLVQGLYPVLFTLYPTFERVSRVRVLQYSNGVRAAPLWLAHLLFDLMFVVVVSVACTALIARQAPFWGLYAVFFVLFFHGAAAALLSYLVSTFAPSQASAAGTALLIMGVTYALSIVGATVGGGGVSAQDGIAYGLGLIFPIQNVIRALSLSLNLNIVRCRGFDTVRDPGSIYAYGGPILLLIIQIVALFTLLLWADGAAFTMPFAKRKTVLPHKSTDDAIEKGSGASSGRPDVDAETLRVESSQTDLLRTLHVTKTFGANTAVDDLSLGLRPGEILALLGPNGAGKTTTINMIRGELSPTSGTVLLDNERASTANAQKHLGVCPQFDALDMLTVREHLTLYARCKATVAARSVRQAVETVMAQTGIAAKASTRAHRLSGGNKRKLSLAIALLGDPPVLLLDEPSSAMDATSKRVLWGILRRVSRGRGCLITTHSMEEADALASRAAIVSGRLLAVGSTQELRRMHSNELVVDLILKSAPLSSAEEMEGIAAWVRSKFPGARFEGENLGGQVRFVVPADSEVPRRVVAEDQRMAAETAPKSYIHYVVKSIEGQKEQLGLDCYSIGAATMERVFLSVVKEGTVPAESDENRPWWRRV